MNWFESFIYGLVSGIAEFLPISTDAHQHIVMNLFGQYQIDPLLDFFVHAALLIAVFIGGRNIVEQLRRQHQATLHNYTNSTSRGAPELRFLKNTILPFTLLYFLILYGVKISVDLSFIAVFSLVNGLIIFLQSRMMQGNKNANHVSIFDSVLVGAAGALSAFTGISRVAAMLAIFCVRGFDRQKSLNWVLALSIPALFIHILIDFIRMFSGVGVINFPGNVFGCILAGIGAFLAGNVGIMILKTMSTQKDISGFSYYSWGVALFSFILYLSAV